MGIVRQEKGDAACQAKQGLAVGMAMDSINVARAIGPPGGTESPGLKKSKYLGFRQWMNMGPAKDLDSCGQGFMIRWLLYIHNCIFLGVPHGSIIKPP